MEYESWLSAGSPTVLVSWTRETVNKILIPADFLRPKMLLKGQRRLQHIPS